MNYSLIFCSVLLTLSLTVEGAPIEDLDPETTNEKPVILPPEPLSRIVFVNDLPPGETVQYDFAHGAKVFVSSSKDKDADSYEENVHILRPDVDGEFTKMNDVGRKVNDETGEKTPVFEPFHYRISIRNTNSQKASLKNPGIIYFLLASDEKHVNNVYESSRYNRRNIFVQSENIENQYVTVLNPTGAVRVSNIHHIDGLTALTVTAGGLEETLNANYTIHDIGKDASQTSAPLFFVEPVLTFRKQLSIFPSSFEITVKGIEIPNEVVIPMHWNDWSLGMSSNYMLRNESNSFKYVFNASVENSQFDVQVI
uniref:DUF4968 domain-containing protein n=1 Tax=Caenorhabditis tropicalis TaxID=1561998 RepID=A0A1I7TFU4_9PELO